MLTQAILDQITSHFRKMEKDVTLVLQTGDHAKREELKTFLSDLVSASDKLYLIEREDNLRSPISFYLEVDGQNTGIHFSGIPGGHEFSSLILAILQAAGSPLKLDDTVKTLVANINQPIRFEVFISLSCHNCPDVVQALNQFALINPNIQSEMIDGGLYQDLIDERNIQGVPSVYLDGELFANGKIDTAQLLDKLIARFPEMTQVEQQQALPVQDVTIIGAGPAGMTTGYLLAQIINKQ